MKSFDQNHGRKNGNNGAASESAKKARPSRRNGRGSSYAADFTFHVPRVLVQPLASRWGFTLIELLVVIGVISILAALVIPITGAVNRNKTRSKARAELAQVEIAIDSYKAKLGHYPPDNPGNLAQNQLYYELLGTTRNDKGRAYFETLDGTARVYDDKLQTAFPSLVPPPKVGGIVNCTRGGGDEGKPAQAFLKGLKPGQIADLSPVSPPNEELSRVKYLACSVPWPQQLPPLIPNKPGANPFRYNSSNPTNNPSSYDLWVDVVINGKTNRICNWSREILTVYAP
jgi:prepilin-type N-terminal cleavage/methylation domain-containing protein